MKSATNRRFLWHFRRTARLLLSLFVMVSAQKLVAQQSFVVTPRGTQLLVYTPQSYTTAKRYPLLLFLSGASAGPIAGARLTTPPIGPARLIAEGKWPDILPFIVVTPLLPKLTSDGRESTFSITSILDDVISFTMNKYRVDHSRIYAAGVSSGALYLMEYLETRHSPIAAAAIANVNPAVKHGRRARIPMWFFISDGVENGSLNEMKEASYESDDRLYNARISLVSGRNADWSELMEGSSGYRIWDWMLSIQKGSKGNIAPYVNAGPDKKVAASNSAFHLASEAFDSDGDVVKIRWSQTSGAKLNVENVNSPFLTIKSLRQGVYRFRLSATDDKGAITNDEVVIEAVESFEKPLITSLILMNGQTNKDIAVLKDGMLIDGETTGAQYNVRAICSSGTGSVRFEVNSDRNARTVSLPPWLMRRQSATPEWKPSNGTCVICATPFSKAGADGVAGTSVCYRVTFVKNPASAESILGLPKLTIRAIDDVLVSNSVSANQWVKDGKDIPGATGPTFRPVSAGSYFVRHTLRDAFDVSNVVDVKPSGNIAAIQVFPGDANQSLLLKADYIPGKCDYRLLKNGSTIQEGILAEDHRILLSRRLATGEYVLILSGKRGDESVKFAIR
jgi:hypothetical protein